LTEDRIGELGRTAASADRFLLVLAGPNGAGKSTFFRVFLARAGIPFVNADLIARAMAPEAPSAVSYLAASAADHERRLLLEQRASFCMETVFSDPAGEKVAFLREAQAAGYSVILVFLGLESPELCIGRVIQRVESGGHDVPDDSIRARYPRTLTNLAAALPAVDHAYLFGNSSCDEPYRFVAVYRSGRLDGRAGSPPPWAVGLPGLEAKRRATRPPRGRRARRPRR